MGAWGTGPFDNDIAADWSGSFDEASQSERPQLILEALLSAGDESGYLDGDVACEAIAAAAVVCSQISGGEALVQTAYAPSFLESGGTIELAPTLNSVAVRAIDRIVGTDSEWSELWEDAEDSAATEQLAVLRELLTRT